MMAAVPCQLVSFRHTLTTLELEVIAHIADGRRAAEISAILGTSTNAVTLLAAAKAAAQADPSPAKKKALATAREVLDKATQQSTGGGFGVSPVMLIVGAGVAYFLIKGKKGGGRKRRKR